MKEEMTAQQDQHATTVDDTFWLDDDQQRYWRSFLDGSARFVEALSREHEDLSSLTLGEYELLVRLSEAADHTLRMSALADGLARSRSRVTHTVHRMEQRGLVRRAASVGDGRGVNCVMTEAGYAELVASAPGHVTAVRRYLVDVLTPAQLRHLGEAMEAIAEACRVVEPHEQ